MKKLISVLMSLLLLFCLVSCGEPAEEEFSKDGLTITLTDSFRETHYENYTACYESSSAAVFAIKESFDLLDGLEDYTLEQYAELVKTSNSSKMPSEITNVDELTTFEYSFYNTEEDATFKYFTVVYKGVDAFWTIQFCCDQEDYEILKSEFIKYAKSVNV